ncbi:MAG: hypothetical protein M3361_11920 [Candidatus Tectomicrobia bacterium]|nr:hypothetical protein [Candidatus Tectomicrobia bacterium]
MQCHARKRQRECSAFLDCLDAEVPVQMTSIHLSGDTARPQQGKHVHAWRPSHPRCIWHCTPVHCSWLNQVEPWCSILQRKRPRLVDFASKADLLAKLMHFIAEWNTVAHPVNWTTTSVANVMAAAGSAAA